MGRTRASWTAVKCLAAIAVLALLCVALRHIGFRKVLAAARRADRASLSAAVSLNLSAFVLWTLRWQQLMRRQERRSVAVLFPIYMAGVFGNLMTPGARVGGEPIRAFYMSRAFGGEKTAYLGTILADKLGNALVFLFFLAASVTFIVLVVPIGIVSRVALEVAVLLPLMAVCSGFLLRKRVERRSRVLARLLPALYGSAPMDFLRRRFPTYQQFEEYAITRLDNVTGPMVRAAGSGKAVAKVVLVSVAAYLLFCLAHLVLFRALGSRIDFGRVIVIVTVSNFLGDISVSPGGAGFMEVAMIAMCAAFGVDARTAAAVTLMSRGIFYLCGFGLGGACLAGLALRYGRRQAPSTGSADG